MSNNVVNFTINLNGNAYTGVAQLDEALGNVLVDVQKTESWFGHLKDTIGASSIKFDAFIGVIGKVSQAFQAVVGSSLDFEQQQANLRTLLNGDAEATENLVGQIREYGKDTVYSRGSLIEAQKTMMAFGLDAEYAFGKLKNIGDIALGDSQKMNSLALAFSQMSSTGKLMGQDFNQMVNAGFNPLEVISQKTGKSLATLKEEMSKGAISADMVAQAFEWATEEGGRFYQGAESAAETTAGKIAKMNDTIDDLKIKLFEATGGATAWIAEIGNMVVPISQMLPLIQGVFSVIKGGVGLCIKGVKNLILAIRTAGGFFPWLKGVASVACKGISAAIGSIPIVGWVAIAITAVTAFTAWLYTRFESVRNWLDGIGSLVVMLAGPFGILINLVTSFIKHWQSIKTAFSEGGILAGIKRIGFVIIDAMLKPVQALLELLSKIPKLGNLASKGADWIDEMRNKLDKSTYVEKSPDASVLKPKAAEQKPKPKGNLGGGELGKNAGRAAGEARQINITLGNMVGTMNFNGGLADNRASVERDLTEMMARILGMAETAI